MRTAEQIRYLILAAQREGNRQLTVHLAHIGLTPAQSEALGIIADFGPLALKDLGDMLVCDSGNSPSRIVDRLVSAGLVQRDADDRDRRQIRLSATTLGHERAGDVRVIESQLYDGIDTALDAESARTVIGVLRGLTHGSPAGTALDVRLETEASSA